MALWLKTRSLLRSARPLLICPAFLCGLSSNCFSLQTLCLFHVPTTTSPSPFPPPLPPDPATPPSPSSGRTVPSAQIIWLLLLLSPSQASLFTYLMTFLVLQSSDDGSPFLTTPSPTTLQQVPRFIFDHSFSLYIITNFVIVLLMSVPHRQYLFCSLVPS